MVHDIDRALSALHAIDPGCDRDTWFRLGAAAKAAGVSLDEFDAWSSTAGNYSGRSDTASMWRSLNGNGGVTEATLYRMALDEGWRDPARLNGHAKAPERAQATPKTEAKPKRLPFDIEAAWRDSVGAPIDHPYVAKKLGLTLGLRVHTGTARIAGESLQGALLVPAYDATGKMVTMQAILPSGKKLNAPGKSLSGWFTIQGNGDTTYICEGIGQAWSAHQATSRTAVCAFGVGNLEKVARQLKQRPGSRIVLVADVGVEKKIESIARSLGAAWIAPPSDLGDKADVNDVHCRDGLQVVAELLAQAKAAISIPAPLDILRDVAAPPFELSECPDIIGDLARAYSEATGFDRSGLIVAAVVAAASMIDDRYRLAVRPQSDWFESPRLWATLIGTPAAGKTPTLRVATDPIKDLHKELFVRWQAENEGNDTPQPKPALYTSDATIEALADRLKDNPRGMLMVTEEFSSWIGGIDAYRDGAGARSRGEWLQLFDGGPHQIDRVKRGSFLVPNWGASVLAACTPAGLRDQMKRLPDDGLIHRFIPCIMRSPGPDTKGTARDALLKWSNRLREVFAGTTCEKSRIALRISAQAAVLFDQELAGLRTLVDSIYATCPALASHLGKHGGMLARVAMVFHVLDQRQGDAIEPDTMDMAIRFMRKVRRHAAAMFMGILSTAPAIEIGRALACSIVADESRPATIGRNWMTQHCRAFRTAEDHARRSAVGILEDAGWIQALPESRSYGGWLATEWAIDARVYDLFAAEGQRQRERRAAIKEAFGS